MLQKFRENTIKKQRFGSFGNHRGGVRGDPPGPQEPSRRALAWDRAWERLDPWWPPGCPPSPIYSLSQETSEERTLFRDFASVPPPPRFQDGERQQTSSRHPAGGRI